MAVIKTPHSFFQLAVGLAAMVSIAGLAFFGYEAVRQFKDTNDSWREFTEQSDTINSALNDLQGSLGYNGFIHHFKNYILRRDAEYIGRIRDSEVEVQAALARLDAALTSSRERRLLENIKQTFFEYQLKLQAAMNIANDVSSREFDAMTTVDDTVAGDAIDQLLSINETRAKAQEAMARASFEDGIQTLIMGGFVIVVIIVGAIVIVAQLGRMEVNAAQLERASRQAAEASAAKSKFLAAMSHEIRTPLNAVIGVLQLIDETSVPRDVAQKLKVGRESGNFLLALINQVLDFAKIEAGTITLSAERFSLPLMLDAMQSMFKVRSELKGVELNCRVEGDECRIYEADCDRIRQVLFNLIGNAVKFTESGSIDVVARVIDISDERTRIEFSVTDSGPGIIEDDRQRIFEEFVQSDVGLKHGGGTGLGLSISKLIADAMDGHLELTSDVGVGSTFTFTVDVAVAANRDRKGNSDDVDTSRPMRILVAEDNSINEMIIHSMLEEWGHDVTVVSNGQKAVDAVKADPAQFDIILMDVQMPVMDGLEATAMIREIAPDGEKLPIVALTANAFSDQKQEYLMAGMQGVVTKPIDMANLYATLNRFSKQDLSLTTAGPPPTLLDDDIPRGGPIPRSWVNVPVFDERVIDQLSRTFTTERMAKLRQSFITRAMELTEELRNADDDRVEQGNICHELAGMLGNMGLSRASSMAKEVEGIAVSGGDISAYFSPLENELAASIAQFDQRLQVR